MPQLLTDPRKPQNAADLMRPNQFQAPQIPNILDSDPGTFGAGRDDLFDQYAKAAALKGLSLANDQKQQALDAADPQKARINAVENADYMGAAAQNGTFDAADNYGAKKASNIILGNKRADNQAQVELEGNPVHQSFVDRQAQNGLQRVIAPIEAKAALAGEKPMSAMNERTMANYEDTQQVGQHLIDLIDKYDASAKDFKNQHGILSQIPQVGSAMFKSYLLSKGFTDPQDDEQWLAGLLQAKGLASSLQGRPIGALINIIKQHLTDPSYDFGKNREAAQRMLNETEGFKQNMINVHKGNYAVGGGGASDPLGLRNGR